ncbi:MAG: CDGSH iron-sulfur domain-containing protein [Candidatus Omnitrophota bacterium]
MAEPHIAQKRSYKIEMEPGTYAWCACGLSKGQPFCDGSHKGTEFSPLVVKVEEKKLVSWCGCKHAKTKPFCDHTHRQL